MTSDSDSQKLRSKELAILYTVGNMLDRMASTFQHLLGSPLMDMRLTLEEIEGHLCATGSEGLDLIAHVRKQIDLIQANCERFCADLPSFIAYGRANPARAVKTAVSALDPGRLEEEGIRIQVRIAPEMPDVYASSLLQEHLFNLLSNSVSAVREAMPGRVAGGGLISVEVRRAERPEKVAQANGAECVVFEVSDNGTGVPAKVEGMLGTFGFTTKQETGTGYGLAAAIEYVRSLGGSLSWENHPGAGFTVRFTLAEYDVAKHTTS